MKKIIDIKSIALLLIIMISFSGKAQITLIPDWSFESYLVNVGIDSDGEVNGQMLTSDAESVEELFLWGEGIDDISGLEDFINLEKLTCYYNPLNGYMGAPYGTINVSTLVNLKELDVRASHLEAIDVSNNVLLEKILIGNEGFGDIPIISDFTELDLSNNPSVNYVDASNFVETFTFLNMRNNNAESVYIDVSSVGFNNPPTVCIEVDNAVAATERTEPYNDWTVIGNYFFSENCALSTERFVEHNFSISPNPASDYVSVQQKEVDVVQLRAVQILDSSGKWIKSVKDNFTYISVSDLSKGVYLFVIQTDKGNKTEKVIVE